MSMLLDNHAAVCLCLLCIISLLSCHEADSFIITKSRSKTRVWRHDWRQNDVGWPNRFRDDVAPHNSSPGEGSPRQHSRHGIPFGALWIWRQRITSEKKFYCLWYMLMVIILMLNNSKTCIWLWYRSTVYHIASLVDRDFIINIYFNWVEIFCRKQV